MVDQINTLFEYEDSSGKKYIVEINYDSIIGFSKKSVFLGFLKDSNNKLLYEVAIKLILGREEEEGMNEIKIMQDLKHENLIKLYSSNIFECKKNNNKRFSIVMEYCKGGDLSSFFNKNPNINEAQIRSYFKQIVHGLDYLHSRNIMHRDIKPQNILLTDDNNTVRIADYDVSKYLDLNIKSNTLEKGTFGYMAPEVLERHLNSNDKNYDFSADIFSLGVTFFYMFYKREPWVEISALNCSSEGITCGSLSQIYKENLKLQYSLFPSDVEVSLEAKTLILKMLKFRANERIKLSEIMEDPYIKRNLRLNDIFEKFDLEGKKIVFANDIVEKIYNFDDFCENKVVWINAIYYILKYIQFSAFSLLEVLKKKGENLFRFTKPKWEAFCKEKDYAEILLKTEKLYVNSSKDLESFLKELPCDSDILDKSCSFVEGFRRSLINLLKEYKISQKIDENNDFAKIVYEIIILMDLKAISYDGKLRKMNLESFDKEIDNVLNKNKGLILQRIYFFFKLHQI